MMLVHVLVDHYQSILCAFTLFLILHHLESHLIIISTLLFLHTTL
jgi:hypothetical protein